MKLRPLFYAAMLLSGCATAPAVPPDKLACFTIEEYRHCVAITGEYRPEIRRELGKDYCRTIAIGEAVNVAAWKEWKGGYLWGCEK